MTREGVHPLLLEAAVHLRSALERLDAAKAPAQIGAHVDLALHQLEEAVASFSPEDRALSREEQSRA